LIRGGLCKALGNKLAISQQVEFRPTKICAGHWLMNTSYMKAVAIMQLSHIKYKEKQ